MEVMRVIFLLPAVAGVLSAGIVNPGFETGDLTGWLSNTGTVGTQFPHSGTYSAQFFGSNDLLMQSVTTIPGNTYSLSFWLTDVGPGAPPNGTFQVDWDNGAVLTFSSFADIAYTEYVIHNLTATQPSTNVTFLFGQVPVDTGLCSSAPGTWALDDVTVYDGNGTPPDAVPEPASLGIAALAAAGLLALNLRRR
ncbi:MAG TPA: PEP-CTERM sorting domain-containing protein [Candidatus Solibacter sp.]|nr:PEP-CTERM sorting domain-containing protein [Candidatus Solibacter sp.]